MRYLLRLRNGFIRAVECDEAQVVRIAERFQHHRCPTATAAAVLRWREQQAADSHMVRSVRRARLELRA